MLTVSLRELHRNTGKFVHLAATEPVRVTERGRVIARLGPDKAKKRVSFRDILTPERAARMPKLKGKGKTASEMLSEDRDDRF